MNFNQYEYSAEYNRQKVQDEFDQIKLEQKLSSARIHRPSLLSRALHGFSGWMITAGKELHKRYELPTAHSHETSNSFAN